MKKIVITGGPGSGKTVITATLAAERPARFVPVPEAATQVYTQLQTRWDKLDRAGRCDAQRRMYRLQLQQEFRLAGEHPEKVLLLDRGTVDGSAYWPDGPEAFWHDVDTTYRAELNRYDSVILLETCAVLGLYDGDESNFCRFEDADAAVRSSEQLKQLWAGHPHLVYVDTYPELGDKLAAVRRVLDEMVPPP